MKIETIICDCCNEEIPKVKKKDFFGIEREYYRLGKLDYSHPFKDINCRTLGLHLCERCAGDISLQMHEARTKLLLGQVVEWIENTRYTPVILMELSAKAYSLA